MRFVKLTRAELVTLQEGHKNGSQFQFRNRCQGLVLSNQGSTVPELAQFFEITPITIYGWFDRWEKDGIVGFWIGMPTVNRQLPTVPCLLLTNNDRFRHYSYIENC